MIEIGSLLSKFLLQVEPKAKLGRITHGWREEACGLQGRKKEILKT